MLQNEKKYRKFRKLLPDFTILGVEKIKKTIITKLITDTHTYIKYFEIEHQIM
jgi:hypothetical protein